MADVEMNIEINNPRVFDDHVDDIIDFDTDMVDHHDQASNTGHPQKLDEATEAMDRDMKEPDDSSGRDSYQTNGMVSEDVDFDLHDVEDTEHHLDEADHGLSEGPEQKHEAENTSQSFIRGIQGAEEYVEASNETDGYNKNQDEGASAHEIDYELDDNIEKEDPHEEAHEEGYYAANLDEPDHLDASGAEDAAGDDPDDPLQRSGDGTVVAQNDSYSENRDQMGQHASALNEIKNHAHQEVAQQDEAADFGSAEGQAAGKLSEAAPEDGENYNSENPADPGEFATHEAEPPHQDAEGVENAEGAEDNAYDEAKGNWEEHDEDQEAAGLERADLSATGDDGDNSGEKFDSEFPAITVHYKGDEFPLFSTTSDGFFADTSILDETLEKLLAGLRRELENEIAEDDELVFQVDELGLELAESTQGELMSSVTFRQILEIFDLLVKNQDPDSSRTMYTYLFTKPNTEKRLESLIDSATAGKGLDEVIHLFQSPMPTGSSILEANTAVDGLHEELDDFDSPVDEVYTSDAQDPQPGDEHPEGDDLDADLHPSNDGEEDDQDDHQVETEPSAEIRGNAPNLTETTLETNSDSDAAALDDGSEENAPTGGESDPFANLELDDSAELDDAVDLGGDAAAGEHVAVENAVAHAPTNDTSTTTTLRDEDEAGSINVDLGADVDAEEAPEGVEGVEENDLDEIDWRDQPEANDEGPSTPSAAGKRARGDDDDVDAEDEQDVKRRRP